MKADVGDRIVVASGTLHRPIRDGEVLETGPDGAGPYLVRWSDSGNLFSLVRTRMSSMSSGRPATMAVSRSQQDRVRRRRRNGASRSICMKIRAQRRPTPSCTATYLGRSMFRVKLGAARLIRYLQSVTRWRRLVLCVSSPIAARDGLQRSLRRRGPSVSLRS